MFFSIFSKSIYSKLCSRAYLRYFQVYVNYGPWDHIFGPFLTPKNGENLVKIKFLFPFCKKFPLVLYETCYLSSLELLVEVCRIWALRGRILGPFLTQTRSKFRFLSIVQDVSAGFTRNLFFLSSLDLLLKVFRIQAPGPYFRPLTPNTTRIVKNQVFFHFATEKFPFDSNKNVFLSVVNMNSYVDISVGKIFHRCGIHEWLYSLA